MARPFISFLSDFGFDGAAAICRGVMLGIAPDAQIVDIAHSVGKYAIRDGAYLLWTALHWMPVGAHLGVVDPGVGTSRRPVAVRVARGDALVGPDNGLLLPATTRLGGIVEARELDPTRLRRLDWIPSEPSHTFHGRDLFAPVAARLALGEPFEDVGEPVDPSSLVALPWPTARANGSRLETAVLYTDSFGNLRLAGTRGDLEAAIGSLEPGQALLIQSPDTGSEHQAAWAETFGAVSPGEPLVYVDSSGSIAIAVSQGSATAAFGLATGSAIRLARA
jgi:S-adenosylmethionine hydrolase